MKKFNSNKQIKTSLSLALILSMMIFGSSCAKKESAPKVEGSKVETTQIKDGSKNVTEIGKGSTSFPLTVATTDKKETNFIVKTDKKTVGEALQEVKLVEGQMSDKGLYIKKVNGIEADYDKDKTYWAFYVNGKYADKGVDSIPIDEKSNYMLKVEK